MDPIRVLLADTPDERSRALSAILRAQQDIIVVANEPDLLRALIAVGETNADIVLVRALNSAETPPIVGHLLMEYPGLIIIADGAGMTESSIYRFRLERVIFADDGGTSIIDAIRRAHREAVTNG